MSRMRCLTIVIALAAAGLLAGRASSLQAQTARSWCLILPGGEPGGCNFPTFEACRADSAGFGTCIATDRPAAGAASVPQAAPVMTKRRR